MRVTAAGKVCLLLIALALWNAANGGLNVLYLVTSGLIAAFVVSLVGCQIVARCVTGEILLPAQLFVGDRLSMRVVLRNRTWLPVFGVRVVTKQQRVDVSEIRARGEAVAVVPYHFTRRGWCAITDVFLEVAFPMGLVVARRRIPAKPVLIFPRPSLIPAKTLSEQALVTQTSRPRRGVGEEFYGIREYTLHDDPRLINWKVSARMGRPMIVEYAEMVGDRVVLRVNGSPPGEMTEQRICETASAAKHFLDQGVEVRLVTDEGDTGFGRGLVQVQLVLTALALLGNGKRVESTGQVRATDLPLPALTPKTPLYLATVFMSIVMVCGLWLIEGLDLPTKMALSLALPAGILCDRKGFYPIPAGIFNFISLIVLALVIAVDIPIRGLLPGLTHLIGYALLNRWISPKQPRDTRTIVLILFLLFLLFSWQTMKPSYFPVWATFMTVGALWLMAAQEQLQKIGLMRIAVVVVISLHVLLLAGVVFAAIPRLTNPRFAQLMRQMGLSDLVAPDMAIITFADRVRLGSYDEARKNRRRVMQVRVSGMPQGELESVHIRGAALTHFDGSNWTRSRPEFWYRLDGRLRLTRDGWAQYAQRQDGYRREGSDDVVPNVTEEFYIYPLPTSLIFSIGDPTWISGHVVIPSFDASGTVASASSFAPGGRYVIQSRSTAILLHESLEDASDLIGPMNLQLPEGMGDVARFADSIAAAYPTDESKAVALEQYLKRHFTYSSLGIHGRQSLADFLFHTRAGNCEYFATAMTLMLRTLGIPARFVVGFLASDYDRVGGFYDVRNSDAHAWVEVFLPHQGWMTFDPTPSAEGSPWKDSFFGITVTRYFLGLQMSWYRHVIGYDFYLQQRLLTRVIDQWRGIAETIAKGVVIVGLMIGVVLFVRRYTRPRKQIVYEAPATQLWREAERVLARYGFTRSRWESPCEFAERVAAKNPGLDIVRDLLRAYYGARYGNAPLYEVELALRMLSRAARRSAERTLG